ncbi:WD repeat domain 92, partial [Trypanosoma grayi]|uniref:WD repeat domain 92 n=1 Tax=Trypanosoma grayi TaxID=71804 RepID=UPI0004F40732
MSYLVEEEERERKREEQRRVSRQQVIEHVKKNLLYTAFDVKWVPNSASFAVVGQYPNNQGAISLLQLNKGELRVEREIKTKMPIKCCTFGHNSPQQQSVITLCTGDFAGGLSVCDVERLDGGSGDAVFHVPHAHESIINAVDGAQHSGPPEIA